MQKYGIIYYITPVYTKELNGLIERINFTLLNKVRAFLINLRLSKYLSGKVLLAAVYIYNRTPYTALKFKSPFEIYYKNKPYIQHICTWGSMVYYNTNKYKEKLESRTNKGVIIGYGTEFHHYKIWDLKTRKPVWARDVNILENQFITDNNRQRGSLNKNNKTVDFQWPLLNNQNGGIINNNSSDNNNNGNNNNVLTDNYNNNNNVSTDNPLTNRYNTRSNNGL